MPFRIVPDRRLMPLLAAVEALFWLPSRVLALVAGARGSGGRRHETASVGAANDNSRAWSLASAEAANSNVPRRLA